jgi:uncharacterized membrane protein YeaQ/YmgE (transglycosylase-associated protein family)
MSEVWIIVIAAGIGLVTGWLADLLTSRRHGLVSTLAVGLVGAFLGAFVANVLDTDFAGRWSSPALAGAGAIFLLVCLAAVRRSA